MSLIALMRSSSVDLLVSANMPSGFTGDRHVASCVPSGPATGAIAS